MKAATPCFRSVRPASFRPLLVLLFLTLALTPTGRVGAAQVTDVAWSQFDGQRFEIFYGRLENGELREKIQVTNDPYNNMHPSLLKRGGELWLAWTAMDGAHNKLFYSRYSNGSWSFPEEIPTGLQSSIAPFLALDAHNTPWVTWAGFNGKNDDVYVSHWTGSGWSVPVRVHPANATPDILPTLQPDGQGMLVTWQGYDGKQYRYYKSRWDGHRWSAVRPETQEEEKERQARTREHDALQAALPTAIKPMGKAALITR